MVLSRVVLLVDVDRPRPDEVTRGLDPALRVDVRTGSSVEHLSDALSSDHVEIVILGSNIDPRQRQTMIERVLSNAPNASIHIQPTRGEAGGFIEFVNGVLTGLAWHQWDWSLSAGEDDLREPHDAAAPRPPSRETKSVVRRILDYVFGRSDPPMHPPPPPYSPGAGH